MYTPTHINTHAQLTDTGMEELCEAASDTLELKQVKNRNWRKCLHHKGETLHELAAKLLESGWVSSESQQKGRASKGSGDAVAGKKV